MFLKKRTRLYNNLNLFDFFLILKSFFKKKEFQKKLSIYLNKNNISLTSQGRVAFYEIIKLVISEKKNKIILSPFTLPEIVYAIIYAGGEPKFIDLDLETGLVDANQLKKEINEFSAAVLITHLYSSERHINNFINEFSGKIKIIEDAAINLGAKTDQGFLGTLADYGFFSFNIVKNLNTLHGGAIFVRDNAEFENYKKKYCKNKYPKTIFLNNLIVASIIKIFFNNILYQFTHYILKFIYKYNIKFILKKIYPVLFYKFSKQIPSNYNYDFNYLMDCVACDKLEKINIDINERIQKAMLYEKFLNTSAVKKFKFNFNSENIFLEYPVILNKFNNKVMHKILWECGYDIRHTWYLNNARNFNDYNSAKFKTVEIIEDKIFCLPLHKNIKNDDIKSICNIINNCAIK